MRVHHLNCGTMRPLGMGTMVCHCLLIEANDGLVLVDTGLGTSEIEKPAETLAPPVRLLLRPQLDPEETAVRQVVRLGFAVDDVRHIVLTHLDADHAGGLRDFPRATVHISEAEHSAATAPPTFMERQRYRPAQWSHDPRWALYRPGGDPWFGFEAVRQLDGLPPDILLIPLAGHTRGHSAVAVRPAGSQRWLLHCGDAYFHHGEADPVAPHCPRAVSLFQRMVQVDGRTRLANQARLRELVAAHGDSVEVFSAHDAVELAWRASSTMA